ncbi:uncharacterized protein LOC113464110, partial [Ceratina calcarata]|uniref:Uncharacterized protein LOC113464110 n=1 Tax=Ceratina calcarata TaxID=156304 RepID=A0AAJ7RZC0_9HYME
DTWKRTADNFWAKWNFPNCIGVLDGKHVVIEAPANSGSQYYNYKKTFSIDVGGYGKSSAGGIFANYALGLRLEAGTLDVPEDRELPGSELTTSHVIVADEAFPLKTYLLRSYPGAELTHDKWIFNYRLTRARRTVENTFGILAQKFRVYQRWLRANPQNADKIILSPASCTILSATCSRNRPTWRPEH